MMKELGKNSPMYSLLPQIKNDQTAKPLCFFLFCFRKGKTKNFSYQFRAVSIFVINILKTRDRKTLFTFIVDCGWR